MEGPRHQQNATSASTWSRRDAVTPAAAAGGATDAEDDDNRDDAEAGDGEGE